MASKFYPVENFLSAGEYQFMPFKYSKFDSDRYLISNDYGEWEVLDKNSVNLLLNKKLPLNSDLYFKLKSKNFIFDDYSSVNTELLASKYRTRKSFIESFSGLHIFVLTLRCNHSCTYCQVSRKPESACQSQYDMSFETLNRNIDLMLQMPSHHLTMEFQGGESSLNMDLVRSAVLIAKQKNQLLHEPKDLRFVICTNLCTVSNDDITFFKEHEVMISTSLDGPKFLHDNNRRFGKNSAYETVVNNMQIVRQKMGNDCLSALMTTTKESLSFSKEIVDEYIKQGFLNVFIRELNPYGFAEKFAKKIGYTTDEFLDFYKQTLNYIIELNKKGIRFQESFAALIIKKLLTPWSTGFVDLQSPCGSGFSVTLYNYDGNIYASDESRMIAESGDQFFKLGNVHENSYDEIFLGSTMQMLSSASLCESLPICSDCAYSSFCGADPVRRYQTMKDIYGHPGSDDFCKKNKAIIQYIIQLLIDSDDETQDILRSWSRAS